MKIFSLVSGFLLAGLLGVAVGGQAQAEAMQSYANNHLVLVGQDMDDSDQQDLVMPPDSDELAGAQDDQDMDNQETSSDTVTEQDDAQAQSDENISSDENMSYYD